MLLLVLIVPKSLIALPVPFETIDEKIDRYADQYNVSASLMRHIVERESGYQPFIYGDKNYVCKRTGEIAPSRGLVQINKCHWPKEYEKAHDVDFSLNFLASKLSTGNCNLWSTCPHK